MLLPLSWSQRIVQDAASLPLPMVDEEKKEEEKKEKQHQVTFQIPLVHNASFDLDEHIYFRITKHILFN